MDNKPMDRLISAFASGNFDVKAEEVFGTRPEDNPEPEHTPHKYEEVDQPFDVKDETLFGPSASPAQIEFEKWCGKQGRMSYDIRKDPSIDASVRAPYVDHQTCLAYEVWCAASANDYGNASTYVMFDQYEWNAAMQSEFENWASDKPLNLDADDSKRHKVSKKADGGYSPINPYKDSLTRLAYDLWMASRDNDKLSEEINDERIRLALREKEEPTCIQAIVDFLRKEGPEFVLDSFATACKLLREQLEGLPNAMRVEYGATHERRKLSETEKQIKRIIEDIEEV